MTIEEMHKVAKANEEIARQAFCEAADELTKNLDDYIAYPEDLLAIASQLYNLKQQISKAEKMQTLKWL